MNRRSFLRFLGVSPALSVVDVTEILERQRSISRIRGLRFHSIIMDDLDEAPIFRMIRSGEIKIARCPSDLIYKLYE